MFKGATIIDRELSGALREAASFYPAVTVTGPRQSGKTTLIQAEFPNLHYAPKLYFWDTGLAASLLGIDEHVDPLLSEHYGGLFETAIITEFYKHAYNQGKDPHLSYYRDAAKRGVDLVIERAGSPRWLVEIKSSSTYRPSYFKHLSTVGEMLEVPREKRAVVYAGDESFEVAEGLMVSWLDLPQLWN